MVVRWTPNPVAIFLECQPRLLSLLAVRFFKGVMTVIVDYTSHMSIQAYYEILQGLHTCMLRKSVFCVENVGWFTSRALWTRELLMVGTKQLHVTSQPAHTLFLKFLWIFYIIYGALTNICKLFWHIVLKNKRVQAQNALAPSLVCYFLSLL